MEAVLKTISENPQYAAIIAAIITAMGTIIAALIAKMRRDDKKDTPKQQETVIIPPEIDPLSRLKSNLGGIKDIESLDPLSDEYYKTLATRLAIQKNDKTVIKLSRRTKHD